MSIRDRFDLVIFDWAGTMVDFGCLAPVRALIEAFAAEGISIDAAAARRDMGKSKGDHVRALLAEASIATAWRLRHGVLPGAQDVQRLVVRLGPLMREYAMTTSTLIPGARAAFDDLRAAGLRVASSTGYTREMLEPVLARAADQGYVPEHVVCAGELPAPARAVAGAAPSRFLARCRATTRSCWRDARSVLLQNRDANIRYRSVGLHCLVNATSMSRQRHNYGAAAGGPALPGHGIRPAL
ncbi:MAG TPA: HAD family hydrolase [Steroidobacteraceae bacterium]|jgi:phosphonoacetaldehyde hydrolase